jgi:hypothetical protein
MQLLRSILVAICLIPTQSAAFTFKSPLSKCALAKEVSTDAPASATSRRSFLDKVALATLMVGVAAPVESARASGGATAGGAYLLSAKQRYNERVAKSVKGLLLVGEALAAGDSKATNSYFSGDDGGSWKDLTASGYLLSNAFRRSSATAPDKLPAVKVSFRVPQIR